MRVMVMVRSILAGDPAQGPPPEFLESFARFSEDLSGAGVLVTPERLLPAPQVARVVLGGAGHVRAPVPGRPGEVLIGFWVWRVRDMEEALAWARRCPSPPQGACELEIRPLLQPEDLPGAAAPEPKPRAAASPAAADGATPSERRAARQPEVFL